MPKYTKINGKLVLKDKVDTSLKKLEVGHTYVPIKNKYDDKSGSTIPWFEEISEPEILKQYRHCEDCALCRAGKKE